MSDPSASVLVVGAGPTGLTVALELARRDVAVRIIDKAPAPDTQTRALGMQARSLELFERHGTVPALLARGLRADRFHVFSEGRRILEADFSGLPTAYPYLLMIPQNETETVLAGRLRELGTAIERSTQLVSLQQSEGRATAVLRHADGQLETTAFDWVVGADGAHSTVRKALGIEFVGSSFEESFAVADLRIDWDRPQGEFFAFLDRGRFAAFFPMLDGWHRVAIARPTTSGSERTITQAELERSVTATVPGRAVIQEVRQAGLFRINQRRAQTHRRGAVFLVGDAAHIHSVIGAQGMNTGIQDAFNLGWKLAAVIHGTADAGLLDTYAAERAPVAARLVRGTRRVTRMTLLRGPVSTAARRLVAPRVLGREAVRSRLTRAISQVDVSYHNTSASSPPGRMLVGDRAPDAPIPASPEGGATRVHELLHPTGFTVLSFGDLGDDLADVVPGGPEMVRTVPLSLRGAAARAYGMDQPGQVLVRPDGYVAGRGSRDEVRADLERLRTHRTKGGRAAARTPTVRARSTGTEEQVAAG